MSDLPGGGAVHEVVAAVLAASPTWDGLVFTGTTPDGQVAGRLNPTWSPVDHPDALLAAARQAAAAIRAAADRASSTLVGDEAFRVYTWLRALADEIDPQESRDDRH